jgi:hypothetical protein
MARDQGQRREEWGREDEEYAHRSPRRVSRRHGGAVPARPARCHPRKSSPRHHREHRIWRFHRRATTPRFLGEAPLASESERGRRGLELSGGGGVKSRAGSSHRSPQRGGGLRNYLVEVEEGAGIRLHYLSVTRQVYLLAQFNLNEFEILFFFIKLIQIKDQTKSV